MYVSPSSRPCSHLGVAPLRDTTRPLRVALPFPRTDVVPDGVTDDIFEGLFGGHILTILTDHSDQLGLVVGLVLLRALWDDHDISVVRQRGGGLGEQRGEWRRGTTTFLNWWLRQREITTVQLWNDGGLGLGLGLGSEQQGLGLRPRSLCFL